MSNDKAFNKQAAKAVAGISVLKIKWLSCLGVPLVGAPPCSKPTTTTKKADI